MGRVKSNEWQKRYKNGYQAYVEHSSKKGWTDIDRIPRLDSAGCSGILILHFPYLSNPVGMSTSDHSEPGFFHAQAGPYGAWYVLDSRDRLQAGTLVYGGDGWKLCTRPEPEWPGAVVAARLRIENGDWRF